MNYRPDLVRLITNGASEAELVEFFTRERDCTEGEAYQLLEIAGIEFGRHRRYLLRHDDNISDERRRYLQQLSLSDE